MKKRMSTRLACFLLLLLTLLSVSCQKKPSPPPAETSGEATAAETADPTPTPSEPKHYQVIYNSDATHIMQNESPYHEGEQNSRLTTAMVKEAVQEAIDGGIDCYTLAPGQCWVPWWESEYYKDHVDWYINELGGKNMSNPYWNYIHTRGNDMIRDCIDVCRENDVGFFVSFRLNDHHHIGDRDASNSDIAFDCELVLEHPEYQIGWVSEYAYEETVLDFQYEAVVENRLNYIRELIENYELDGFELDFTRRYCLFNVDTTTEEQRLEIMTGIVSETRKYLDAATAKDGRYRHLSVRIPIWDDYYSDMGIDLAAFEEAGVTIFNFTSSYYTSQLFDLVSLKEQIKEAEVYCEIHFASACDFDEEGKRIHRRATVEQLCTTALMAYEQGADGISVFNFQYYRGDRVSELDKPYTEPPWEVLSYIGDEAKLRTMSQHYFIGRTVWDRIRTDWEFPTTLSKGQKRSYELYLVSPAEGWSGNGVLSIQTIEDFTNQEWRVKVNGTVVTELSTWAGKPYENPYSQTIGDEKDHKSFLIPLSLLQEGSNTIEIEAVSGASIQLFFLELALQAA